MDTDEIEVIDQGAPREVPPKRQRSLMGWILGLLAGAVLTVILLGAGLWMATGYELYHLVTAALRRIPGAKRVL